MKMSFPTLARLEYPHLLKRGANKLLDLTGYSMEHHPLYAQAIEYPLEKVEIDGTADNEPDNKK